MRASRACAPASRSSYASMIAARSIPIAQSIFRTPPLLGLSSSARAAAKSRSKRSCRASAYNPPLFGLAMLMVRFLFLLAVFLGAAAHAAAPPPPPVMGKAWIVGDLTSGQVLVAQSADERFDPASLTKLMTAYLVFAALRDKKLALEQSVTVSERAWRAPGSRMFIKVGTQVSVDDLIRGMEVQSGNDASIALAEAVAGSEDVFAQMMNKQAERLGMKNTSFRNATGLPDPQHYSTAQDLYILTAALIRD